MATPAVPTARPEAYRPAPAEPVLEPGDRLSRDEFERRYERMPDLKKAELIEGIVYMPSPVRVKKHAQPHSQLGTWLGVYAAETRGLGCFDNSTVRLDLEPTVIIGGGVNFATLSRGNKPLAFPFQARPQISIQVQSWSPIWSRAAALDAHLPKDGSSGS